MESIISCQLVVSVQCLHISPCTGFYRGSMFDFLRFVLWRCFILSKLFSLNVARLEERGFNQRGRHSLANTYFVKTLFHLFK